MTARPSLLRVGLIVVLAGLLQACGFQPLYGGAGFARLPGLEIDAGSTRQDYLIEDGLRDFLGGGRSPYRLALETETRERSLGVSATGRASRFEYIVAVEYVLSSASEEPVIGEFSHRLYFDAPQDPYALLAARADAEERAANQIVERLVREIASALRQSEG